MAQRACSQEVWCLGTDWHSCMERCQRTAWKLTLCLCSPLALSRLQQQHHVCLQRAPSSFPSLSMWVCAVCGGSGHVSSSGHTAWVGAQSRCMCDQPAPGALCLPHRNTACASKVADELLLWGRHVNNELEQLCLPGVTPQLLGQGKESVAV